jgi:hypothetical protein
VTNIESQAFQYCVSLARIDLPAMLKTIGNEAFRGCSSLASVAILEGGGTTQTDAGEEQLAPARFVIGHSAFYGCKCLSSFKFPESNLPAEIGSAAFYQCVSLVQIDFPALLTTIGDRAFYGCFSLASVAILDGDAPPSRTVSIGRGAFHGCESITCFKVPHSNLSVQACSFNGCTRFVNLQDICDQQVCSMSIVPTPPVMKCVLIFSPVPL